MCETVFRVRDLLALNRIRESVPLTNDLDPALFVIDL
jgi:hypothetical protein